jgi:hypothetical protein
MGFTEPGRSPGLLVSSYLTVSPLPRPRHRGAPAEAVYSLWHFPYPVPRCVPGRWALPTIAPCGVRTFLRGMTLGGSRQAGRFPSRPSGSSPGAAAITAPATNSDIIYEPGFARPTRGGPPHPVASLRRGRRAIDPSPERFSRPWSERRQPAISWRPIFAGPPHHASSAATAEDLGRGPNHEKPERTRKQSSVSTYLGTPRLSLRAL